MSAACCGVAFCFQPRGALRDAEAAQEIALCERAMRLRARAPCGAGERGEIDLRGEIGLARVGERIGIA